MFNWGSDKKQETPQISQSREAHLRSRFSKAVYGSFCRTRTYEHEVTKDLGRKFWREALYLPDENGWQIFDVVWRPYGGGNENMDKPSLKKTPAGELGRNFFDVIESLALYEGGQDDQGFTLIDENEAHALGGDYFITFAEKEGIAFDVFGMPHPTTQGHIVSSEEFAEDAQEKSRKAYESKKVLLPDLPVNLLPVVSAHPLLAESIEMQPIVSAVDSLKSYVNRAMREGWYYSHYDTYTDFIKKLPKAISYARSDFEDGMKNIDFSKMENGTDIEQRFKQAFDLAVLYSHLYCAQGIHKGLIHHSSSSFYTQKKYRSMIQRAYNKLKEMGYGEDYNSFADDWVANKEVSRYNDPEEIEDIKNWFIEFQQAMKDATQEKLKQTTKRLPQPRKGPGYA